MKHPPLNVNEYMSKMKNELPSYRDGGPTWNEIAMAGLLYWKTQYKFARENELFETIDKVFKAR